MATTIKDLANFDWDDTALQKAYDKGVKMRSKFLENMEQKTKNSKKSNSKENAKPDQKWKVGDYCQAIYTVDQLPYEAKICSFGAGGMCTVEFIGYGDKQTVSVKELKQSHGKQARKKQNKMAQSAYSGGYSSANESQSNASDAAGSRRSISAMKMNETQQFEDMSYNYPALDNSTFPIHQPHTTTCCAAPPAPMHANMPFLPKPPPPPMPQCASVAQNPSLTAMLVSWYMAGYYTGLHQAQKGTQCSQRCCGHSNSCCHH